MKGMEMNGRYPEDEMYDELTCPCGARKQKYKGKFFCPDCDPPEEPELIDRELWEREAS